MICIQVQFEKILNVWFSNMIFTDSLAEKKLLKKRCYCICKRVFCVCLLCFLGLLCLLCVPAKNRVTCGLHMQLLRGTLVRKHSWESQLGPFFLQVVRRHILSIIFWPGPIPNSCFIMINWNLEEGEVNNSVGLLLNSLTCSSDSLGLSDQLHLQKEDCRDESPSQYSPEPNILHITPLLENAIPQGIGGGWNLFVPGV